MEIRVEMALPTESNMLDEISNLAYELIKIVELERTGIRDGAGCWMGSDPLGGTVLKLSDAWQQYDQYQRKGVEEKQLHDLEKAERAFDSVLF